MRKLFSLLSALEPSSRAFSRHIGGHKAGTCPHCGLKSYRRMSDRERRAHQTKHKRCADRRRNG